LCIVQQARNSIEQRYGRKMERLLRECHIFLPDMPVFWKQAAIKNRTPEKSCAVSFGLESRRIFS
ncbi:hypothetical protein, partial [Brevibacillus agri]|uniref:hypothetical protein n=1 Tax=Brevibacillus agri TaxID=51101 RepID=UPI003D1963BC